MQIQTVALADDNIDSSASSVSLALSASSTASDFVSNLQDKEPQTSGFLGQVVVDLNSIGSEMNHQHQESIQEYRSINSDVVGWIEVPEFNINYPVLQGEDNSEYLRTNINHEYDVKGCIFLDSNYKNPKSPIKLIHGHYMTNGTLFGHLPDLLEYESLDNAPLITYTDDLGTKTFKIFAVFTIDDREESIIVSEYSQISDTSSYKQQYVERSVVPCSEVPKSTELLMLNTCYYGPTEVKQRHLHCVVVSSRIS